MQIQNVRVKNKTGLHLRPASLIVAIAKKFRSRISLRYHGRQADGESILEVLALGAKKDADIAIIAEGPDEHQAIVQIRELFNDGAGI